MPLFDFLKKKKEASKTQETSIEYGKVGSKWDMLGIGSYNPSDISIQTYKQMMKDSTVRGAYNLIKLSTLSRSWKIIMQESDVEVADFLRYSLEQMDGRVEGALSNILTAIAYGFSVTELVLVLYEDGPYVGKIGIKKLKGLDPETITFKTDKYGRLEQVLQDMGEDKPESIPMDNLIIYTYDKEFGNYYGNSRLRSVYKNWFIKDTLLKFWNTALERFGSPILIGTVPTSADLKKMLGILENMQNKSVIAKTTGWEVEALDAQNNRQLSYEDAIKYHDEQILAGFSIPPVLITSPKSGSYALSNTQFTIFQLMLANIENDLCSLVEEYMIKPMLKLNFGEKKVYPIFQFEPLTRQDLLDLSKTFALLVKNGIIGTDETWMRDLMGVPHREDMTVGAGKISGKDGDAPPMPPIPGQKPLTQAGSQQVKTSR